MEETISLQDILKVIKKRLFLIVSLTIISVIIASVVSYFILTPVYQASTQILVNEQKSETESIQSQEIQANLQLINTYNEIIKSPVILDKVIERLDLNQTTPQLSEQISVSNVEESQVISISVEDEQYFEAVNIANTIAEVFQEEIPVLMNANNVTILSPAVHLENPSHVKPNELMNIAIATMIGLLVGVGLAFLREYLDTTIKTEQDVEELLGIPIIGIVSPIPEKELNKRPYSPNSELSRSKSRREKLV
ncbi:YveK family protein [Ureibacillus sp. 179-F W5.1 NHS]|uniref:Capsular biosynthesis protein n=1 Tax=Lysinibacillus halotolerans TaxID=1368476 RepID=A0A3M8HHE0_9BACI|nr:Wzz/FepE/Etk N-terminal domain-containing protein [Lysinibacillus halotolerans]RND01785.1 capsular biosynthesis protein [Lysinibacillus halotolerans]